jgi:hypothetical protein
MDDFTHKTITQILNQLAKERFPNQSPRQALANETHLSQTIIQRYFRGISLGEPSKGFRKLLRTLLKDKDPGYTAIVLTAYLEYVLGKHGSRGGSPELHAAATYLKELP